MDFSVILFNRFKVHRIKIVMFWENMSHWSKVPIFNGNYSSRNKHPSLDKNNLSQALFKHFLSFHNIKLNFIFINFTEFKDKAFCPVCGPFGTDSLGHTEDGNH